MVFSCPQCVRVVAMLSVSLYVVQALELFRLPKSRSECKTNAPPWLPRKYPGQPSSNSSTLMRLSRLGYSAQLKSSDCNTTVDMVQIQALQARDGVESSALSSGEDATHKEKGLSWNFKRLRSWDAQVTLPRLWHNRAAVRIRGGGLEAVGGSSEAPLGEKPAVSPWVGAVEGVKNGFASGLAAAVVKTILQPFDTMKTVQQFSTTRVTLLQAGRDLIARGGVRELYQGLGVTLVGSMPAVGVYFGLYQFVKKQMDAKDDVSPYLSITVSAGIGNFIASFFRVPYEVVKQRLQVGAYPGTMIALQSIYKEEGLWGFFGKGGLKTQWARDIPYAMITLLVYETLQNAASRRKGPNAPEKNSVFENMVIGALAGGMGSLATNPMDMVKTRMMTAPHRYAGPMDAAWKALRMEGPQAFMKGATPRLIHKIPANAFFFVFYELFRNMLGVKR